MKYLAIILLAILGFVEFIVKVAATLVTFFFILVAVDDDFFQPWCWQMAEKVLAS